MNLNHLIGEESGVVNQKNSVQYIRELDFEKDLTEKSVEYAVAYEKLFHMVRHVDVIKVEFYQQK